MKSENLKKHLVEQLRHKQKELDNFSKRMYAHYYDFEDYVDENYEWPEVLGTKIRPSKALYNQDPTAYEHCFSSWAESLPLESFPEYEEIRGTIAELSDWLQEIGA